MPAKRKSLEDPMYAMVRIDREVSRRAKIAASMLDMPMFVYVNKAIMDACDRDIQVEAAKLCKDKQ